MNHLSSLQPADLKFHIADFLVDGSNYLQNRAFFQTNRSFRLFEREFINSKTDVKKCQFLSGLLANSKVRGNLSNIPRRINNQFAEITSHLSEIDFSNITLDKGDYYHWWHLEKLFKLCGCFKRVAVGNLLQEFPHVQKVNLVNCNISGFDVERLTSHPSLQTLMLGTTKYASSAMPVLDVKPNETCEEYDERNNKALFSQNNLRNYIKDDCFEHVSEAFPDLQNLYVGATYATVKAFESIAKLKKLKSLFLALPLHQTKCYSYPATAVANLDFLPSMMKLRHLFLMYSSISNDQLQIVAKLTYLKSLSINCASNTRLTPISKLRNLETLNVNHVKLVDVDLLALSKLKKKLKRLCLISVFPTALQPADISALSSLSNVHTFVLNLNTTQPFLDKLLPLKKLRHLYIRQKLTLQDELALHQFRRLESLNLNNGGERMSSDLFQSISQLVNLKDFSTLLQIQNDDFHLLENLRKLQRLRLFFSASHRILGVVLPTLKKLTALKKFFVINNNAGEFPVSDESLQNIKRALPDVAIEIRDFKEMLNNPWNHERILWNDGLRWDFALNPVHFFHTVTKI